MAKTFSVTTAWTRIEITYPADTTGAFDDNNASSLEIWIWLHAGSTYTSGTLPATWASYSNAGWAYGQAVDLTNSTDNYFQLTGVQLEVSDHATDFEHRSFGQELALCQRYCYKHDIASNNGPYATQYESGHKFVQDWFPVSMRTTPSYTITYNTSSPTPYYVNPNMFKAYVSSAYDSGQPIYMASAIYFAEL